MADTEIDVTPTAAAPTPSRTLSVRRRKTSADVPDSTATDASSNTRRTTVAEAAALAGVRRQKLQKHQMSSLIATFIMAGLTFLTGMWILGFFQRGEWPENLNLHAVSIPSTQYNDLQNRTTVGAPFLLAFYSANCMACRRMRSPFDVVARRLHGVMPCYSVSVGSQGVSSLLDEYEIKTVPSVFLVKADKRRVKYDGLADANKIEKFVKEQIVSPAEGERKLENDANDSDADNGTSAE